MKRNLKQHAMKSALISAFALSAVAFGLNGYAGTETSNLAISATISANCTISTTAVAFGAYDPIVANLTASNDAAGTVVTTCTSGSAPTIILGQGANAGAGSTATVPVRQMASGTDRLGYELYTTAGRTIVWSDTGVATPTADGTAQTNTVYGRIPGAQNKPVGSYADTVLATVTF